MKACPFCAEDIQAASVICKHCHRDVRAAVVSTTDGAYEKSPMMGLLAALLVFLGVVAGVLGLASLSQATAGVGGIAFGCLLAIFARMAQASAHHQQSRSRTVATPVDLAARLSPFPKDSVG